jgi:hypothetical protein
MQVAPEDGLGHRTAGQTAKAESRQDRPKPYADTRNREPVGVELNVSHPCDALACQVDDLRVEHVATEKKLVDCKTRLHNPPRVADHRGFSKPADETDLDLLDAPALAQMDANDLGLRSVKADDKVDDAPDCLAAFALEPAPLQVRQSDGHKRSGDIGDFAAGIGGNPHGSSAPLRTPRLIRRASMKT